MLHLTSRGRTAALAALMSATVSAAALPATAAFAATPRYQLAVIQAPGNIVGVEPFAINSLGHTAGLAGFPNIGTTGYLGAGTGHVVALPAVPSNIGNTPQSTQGSALNDADTVVGWSLQDNNTTGLRTTATMWRNGKVTDLGILPQDNDVEAVGINNNGQIAGSGIGTGKAWLHQNGTTTLLPPLPGGSTAEAFGISSDGQVLGVATTTASNVDAHAVVWRGGRPIDLGVLSTGSYAEARAMNSSGVAVGDASVRGDALTGERHPVTYANGKVTDLWPGLQGTWAFANGINSAGVIVGDGPVGWVYQNGVRTDLNTLIPAGTGYKIVAGEGINDAGQIVALAVPNGSPRQTVAVLLTPVAG